MTQPATIYGTDGDDHNLDGSDGDTVFGLGGNDYMEGGGSYLYGGDGDDYIRDVSFGPTVIFGGSGNDTITDAMGSDTIDAGSGDDIFGFSLAFGGGEIVDVDVVDLGEGNDICGLALIPQLRAHGSVTGGGGVDTLQVEGATGGVGDVFSYDFRLAAGSGTMNIGIFSVTSFEQVVFVGEVARYNIQFGNLNDVYYSSYAGGEAFGNGGDDILSSHGSAGNRLHGGDGNDIIIPDGGNAKANSAFGDNGNDQIYYNYNYADYNSNAQLSGGAGEDGFLSIGAVGSTDEHDTILDFELGKDWLGFSFDAASQVDINVTQKKAMQKYNIIDNHDVLSFDTPSSQYGGPILIHISYDRHSGELFVSAGYQGGLQLVINGAPHLTVSDFFSLTIQDGATFNDLVQGNEDNNFLTGDEQAFGRAVGGDDIMYGYGGDDTIIGDAGNDTIYGGNGNDSLHGEIGADHLDGGGGSDTAFYDTSESAVVVSLMTGKGTAGDAAGDTLTSIENLVGSWFADTLTGNNLDNVLIGAHNNDPWWFAKPVEGGDTLLGFGGNDILDGGGGADTMDGGGGVDTMVGGTGNDTYWADNAGDHVVELNGQGTDTVNCTFSFNLSGQELENLTLTGLANINGTGNSFANVITGNSGVNTLIGLDGSDTLDGKEGADTMQGGIGNDTYFVDNAGDIVSESTVGANGTDIVNSYISINLSDGNHFTDNIENVALRSAASINATGNSLANAMNGNSGVNTLIGLGGNDTLDGKEGADTMQGGIGNDTYYVDNASDIVSESTAGADGSDIVNGYISINLSDGNHFTGNIENVALRSAASINATGNSLANTLTGNSGVNTLTGLGGNDTLDGKEGADSMYGGAGNDTYYVDNAGDIVSESTAGADGTDIVNGYISINLSNGNHFTGNIENVALRSAASINATGNSLANTLTGNSGVNTLTGLGGNDTLDGKEGADTMQGGVGNDTYWVDNAGDHVIELNGQGTDSVFSSVSFNLSGQELENLTLTGAGNLNGTGNSTGNTLNGNSGDNIINGLSGNDTLTGAQGHDSFLFTTALSLVVNVDTITDFSVDDDTIVLDHAIFAALAGNGTLSADQFTANASGTATDANQHIIYATDTGWLYYDSNGDAAGGSKHFATVAANLAMTNADFVVM